MRARAGAGAAWAVSRAAVLERGGQVADHVFCEGGRLLGIGHRGRRLVELCDEEERLTAERREGCGDTAGL